ncbi:FtsX-like permease family protein [Motiliproteus sp. MSK22-1]|uniref:ABC transporter permease n=1 Tax=Motiliproteus sp. MSK22-1 TaxID=1897630 RepID=UPI000977B91F|nr:FtsX-like permease family protein [Motiliproteus sp. MSK22-1]OMH38022.1 hypothetical protein BGP75_06980 [Motiliproteus sp. MSK22-1]
MLTKLVPWPLIQANLGYFRRHKWLLASALMGIILGVAVVAGVEITNDSAQQNFQLANNQLLGKGTHRISAEQTIPESLLTQLRVELGVVAAPLISRHLRLHNEQGPVFQVLGIDPFQLREFRTVGQVQTSSRFDTQDLLLTDSSALMGEISYRRLDLSSDVLTVVTSAGVSNIQILGRIGDADDSRFSRLMLMDIGHAQQLLQLQGRLDAIELRLTDNQAEQVRDWLPEGYRLSSRSELRSATEGLSDSLHLNLSALGLLALVVGLFLVYNTLLFSLLQRQQLFGQLRSLGITQRELLRYLLLELILLGLIGSVLGLLIGLLLADQLLVLVSRTVNDLYMTSPIVLLQLNSWLMLKIVIVGVGGALLAGIIPGRRIIGLSILRGQSRQQLETQSLKQSRYIVRQVIGLVVLALVFSLLPESGVVGGYIAVTALLLACASMMPMLVVISCKGLRSALNRYSRVNQFFLLRIAIGDTERGLSRTAVALMALVVAVSATVGMATMIGSFRSTLEVWLNQRLNADVYVAPESRVPNDPRTLSQELWNWLELRPELEAVASYYRINTRIRSQHNRQADSSQVRQVELFANHMPPQTRAGYRFTSGNVDDIWRLFDQPGQLLISEPLANRHALKTGEVINVETPKGFQQFTVAGVYYDYGHENGRMIISQKNFKNDWRLMPGRVAGLYLKPGVNLAEFLARLEQKQTMIDPLAVLKITESRGVLSRSMAIFERTFLVTDVLRLFAVAVAFVGVLAALLALQLERQQEMHLYRALGFSAWQRIRLLFYQALIIGSLAGVAAIPVGLLLAWGLIDMIQLRAFGWTLVYQLDPLMLFQAPLLSVLAAMLACIYPAWLIKRDGRSQSTVGCMS